MAAEIFQFLRWAVGCYWTHQLRVYVQNGGKAHCYRKDIGKWNCAYSYLTGKQRTKEGDILYSDLQMSEYLLPNEIIFSNEIKRKYLLCQIRWLTSQTTFPKKKEWKCQCVDIENNSWNFLNHEETEINYEAIYSENVKQISEVHRRFQILNEIEERQKNHVILPQDPLYSIYSNG